MEENRLAFDHPLNLLLVYNGHDEALESFLQGVENLHVVGPVSSGKEALTYLENQPIDILLMDPVLPALDGLGVLEAIAASETIQKPAIFAYSSVFWDHMMTLMHQRGVIYCFIRPIQPDRILQCIFDLLNLKPLNEMIRENQLSSAEMLEKEITAQIRGVGIPAHLKGYHYLREAVRITIDSGCPGVLPFTTMIYPQVAETFHTKASLVERAIRHSIEVAWDRGNPEVLNSYFGYTVNDNKGKPTNAEFIAMITDRVRLKNNRS